MKNSIANGHAGTVVMMFSGEYDLASKEQVRAAFDSLRDVPSIALDFTHVTYIDSTIIGELVRMHNARCASGLERETVVLNNRSLLKLVDVLNFSEVFRVVDALDDAISKDGKDIVVRYANSFEGKSGPQRNGSVTA